MAYFHIITDLYRVKSVMNDTVKLGRSSFLSFFFVHMNHIHFFKQLCLVSLQLVLFFFTVRLVEGPDVSEGRVEVYFSGVWGVVCGAGWDPVDAAVLCHSLGYTEVSSFRNNISFKLDNGTLWMTEVQCNGDEASLIHCSHSGWGKNGCAENQAAGVRCLNRGNLRCLCFA